MTMAYLVDIKTICADRLCTSRATVELRDWLNESRGRFCRKHGKQNLRDREKYEKDNPHHR